MSVIRYGSIYANETQQLWKSIDDPTSIGATGPTGPTGATGPQGIQGFSSGAVYYFNRSTASSIPGYFVLSKTPVIGAGSSLTASGAGNVLIGQFATVVGDPDTTVIPAGNYTFDIFVNMSGAGGTPGLYCEIYTRTAGGVETLIADNSADPVVITQGTNTELYVFSVGMPQTLITNTDRIVMKLYATNLGGLTMTVKFEDNEIAQVITSLSPALVGPTGPTGPSANASLWSTYPAIQDINANLFSINNIANVNADELRAREIKIGGVLPLFPAASISQLGLGTFQDINVSTSTLGQADVNIYGANLLAGDNALYVEGGTSLSGAGLVHGVHIGAQTVGGVDLTRIDVLPVGININSDTYVQTAAAGAISHAAGGALSLAAGSYVEINSSDNYCVNTTSGDQNTRIYCASYLAPPSVAATSPLTVQNTAGGGVWLEGVTKLVGSNCVMTGISTINGNAPTTFLAQSLREIQPTGSPPADQVNISNYTLGFLPRTLNNYVPPLSGGNSTTIPGMSVSGTQITLPVGLYLIQSSVPATYVSGFTSRFYNITSASTDLAGTSEWTNAIVTSKSIINGLLEVVGSPKVYQLEQRITTTNAGLGDLGKATNMAPEDESYTNLLIVKIA